MSISEENIKLLKAYNALKEGHFILSSGLHSQYYIQCAKIMANPIIAQDLCSRLVEKISSEIDVNQITKIVAPAMGGLLVGYELARQLHKENIFCERVDGKFEFRRGFSLDENDKVLIVEDVLTTGKSSLETYALVKKYNAKIIAETCLIRRDITIEKLDNVPIISLFDLSFPTYNADKLPDILKKIPASKPGSRFLKTNKFSS